MPAVRAAIDALYTAFQGVPRPTRVHACPCCVGPGVACALLARPLGELTEDELGRYAYKAVTTMGSASDLAYFLPRLLELLATDGLGADPEIVLGKLAFAYDDLSRVRRGAVDAFLTAVLARELARPEGAADAWICGTARGTADVAARLASLLSDPAACAGLRRWVTSNGDARTVDALENGFWGERDAGAQLLVAWLGRTDVRSALGVEPLDATFGTPGLVAEERCLFTCTVDARGAVRLAVEVELHPGAVGTFSVELTPQERRTVATPGALRALANAKINERS